MNVIEEVRRDRQDLARVLKKHLGIRKIVEELYPDSAHFIYELLQNAEDTGATETKFVLNDKSLVFEHNGRTFDADDIYAITDIGEGTKGGDEDKIGRFGIGFKAVFAYTESPCIWSPTFSFEIADLVLPSELSKEPGLGQNTRFEFPFNNPKKPRANAYAEVLDGLNQLSETTLLFLSSIESVCWQIHGESPAEVLRVSHSAQHVEVLKQAGAKTTSSSHFLCFRQPVEGLKKQHAAVAFELDFKPKVTAFDSKKSLANQFRIVPAAPGRVAVCFAALKETSGLRFHLHAPFVPELSRASIKDTPANEPLFLQLAALAAGALPSIRDSGLLTGDFLAVLPNSQDEVPERYQCIREAIIRAMNEEPLTPTHSKSHAPAKYLLQAKASLKALLSAEDIKLLDDRDGEPPKWAIGARQKNGGADRFLSSLDISEWDTEQFLDVLTDHLGTDGWSYSESDDFQDGPDSRFMEWLSAKTDEWHQKFYSMLYRELEPDDELERLDDLYIAKLSTGEYKLGRDCYFATDDVEHDDVLPRIAKGVYTAGHGKKEREDARKLLQAIGVQEVGEVHLVKAILDQRYKRGFKRLPAREEDPVDEKTHLSDLKRFVDLVDEDSTQAKLFLSRPILEAENQAWYPPHRLFLDSPYLETGLREFYAALGEQASRFALSPRYHKTRISLKRFNKFAEAVGVSTHLEVKQTGCSGNPEWKYLRSAPGSRRSSPVNRDFVIPDLQPVLKEPTMALARLLWKTVCDLPRYPDPLIASYRNNATRGSHEAPSQLVHQLKGIAWVPQGFDRFVRPSEATRDLLPEGFSFDPGWQWIKAVEFGEEAAKRTEEYQREREVLLKAGFDDESLNDVKWFAELTPDERLRLKRDHDSRREVELPDHEPSNAIRRAARVGEQAAEAPERLTEMRSRSVAVGRKGVKAETVEYLRSQYTNGDGELICQLCQAPMPFKTADGNYYFESIEFLPLEELHYQNYLALCPNHAAMYTHANDLGDDMKDFFLALDGRLLGISLAGEDLYLYFNATHALDLRAIISAVDG